MRAFGPLLTILEKALYEGVCGTPTPKQQAQAKQAARETAKQHAANRRQQPASPEASADGSSGGGGSGGGSGGGGGGGGGGETNGSGAEGSSLSDWELSLRVSGAPPAIALHSFSGTAHHVKQLLALEKAVRNEADERLAAARPDARPDAGRGAAADAEGAEPPQVIRIERE